MEFTDKSASPEGDHETVSGPSSSSSPSPPSSSSVNISSVSGVVEENKKRSYVIQEIISTEVTYVERLRLALDSVVKPLRESNILNQAEMNNQFDPLRLICELHERHSLAGSTSRNLKFVELFEDMSNHIEVYSNYLMNYEPAMQQRAKLLTSNRRFADFVDKLQKDTVMLGQNMESLLILPVQRIPRYRLLLEQLMKYTEENHPDYTVVKQALEKICELAHYNNEAIRVRENKSKMMAIMMQIEPTTRKDFFEKGDRLYIREGNLMKQCRKRYKEFTFWLFSDILCYGEMTPIALYRFNREIPLASCKITPLDANDPEFGLAFIVASPAKSFKLKASDANNKKDWENAILDAIDKAKQKVGAVDEAIAPIWKPDEKCTNCEICKSGFNILFRKHHCRNCGSIVCTNCSKKRFFLPHVDKKTVRVCDPCFDYLLDLQKNGGKLDGNRKSKRVNNVNEDSADDDDDDDDEEFELRRSVHEDELQEFQEELSHMELGGKGPLTPGAISVSEKGTPSPPGKTDSPLVGGVRKPRRTNIIKDRAFLEQNPILAKQMSKSSNNADDDS